MRQPGEHRRLGNRDLAEVLSEVDLRTLGKPPHAETALRADIDRVGVVLENLFLGQLAFQVQRNQCLRNFALPAALGAQPQ